MPYIMYLRVFTMKEVQMYQRAYLPERYFGQRAENNNNIMITTQ